VGSYFFGLFTGEGVWVEEDSLVEVLMAVIGVN
jgi:hypothetical protein